MRLVTSYDHGADLRKPKLMGRTERDGYEEIGSI